MNLNITLAEFTKAMNDFCFINEDEIDGDILDIDTAWQSVLGLTERRIEAFRNEYDADYNAHLTDLGVAVLLIGWGTGPWWLPGVTAVTA
jgi:hypothetical protein